MRINSFVSVILVSVMTTGCINNYTKQPVYTLQSVQKISLLNTGMLKQEVTKIMGLPVRTEFSGSQEAWHFCKTGSEGSDEFAVVVFSDGKVSSAKNYNVTLADTGGATGDCSKFVRSVF